MANPDPRSQPILLDARLTAHDDAVLTVCGELDLAAVRRVTAVLGGLLDAGAQRMIVDLSGVPAVPTVLVAMLRQLAEDLRNRGGWLLVDGAPEPAEDVVTPLPEAFAAYRQVVAPTTA